ncbi:MAG: NAD(+) diphosphatase [Caulobacterales bacterium]
MPRPIFSPNAFANYPLDKAGLRRRDEAYLAAAAADPRAMLAPFHKMQPFLMDGRGGREIGWLGMHAHPALGAGPLVFLGEDEAGAPLFATDIPERFDISASPIAGLGSFDDMRAAAAALPAGDVAMLGCAKSLFEWHARHRFCSNCGEKTDIVEAGWKRKCAACEGEHFPRVDPVVIMVPVHGDRCCLGRQKRFPPGMYSALAGFVEPGESLEEACAREIFEEVGLRATAVRYHSSQPWPFPSSMMIGLIADVTDDVVTLDKDEIDEAVWLTKEEARQALAGGLKGDAGMIWAPPPLAIAHQILKAWASDD